MGRYTGNVVTETNAFVSQESNTVDPNSDKNPLLDNSDPTEGAEPDREHGDDFQVAGEDLVEKKNVTENDVFQDGEVLNKINEIDNIAKEGQENADAVEALAAVSCEMHAILADRGHLTAGEAMVLRGFVASVESAIPELATVETAMPSMEDFKLPGLEYSNANVSMESISEKINLALNKVETNMVRLFKNGIGLANSMTPLIDAQISRCATVKGSLNGARRDDGQKEVSGGFVKNLSVDGAAPDANTVIKVAKYLEQCNGEIMSPRAMEEAKQLINQLQQTVRNGVDGDVIKSPSILLRTLIVLTAAGYAGIKGAKAGFAAGAELQYQASDNLGVAVGALYSVQGFKGKDIEIDTPIVDGTIQNDYKWNPGYINVPITLNYYPVAGLALKAGLQPGFLVNKDDMDDAKTVDLSIPVGLSYEYQGIVFDARYNIGVTKIADNVDHYNNVIQITVGYKFSL